MILLKSRDECWGVKHQAVLGQTPAIIILSLNKQMVTVISSGLTLMDFQ